MKDFMKMETSPNCRVSLEVNQDFCIRIDIYAVFSTYAMLDLLSKADIFFPQFGLKQFNQAVI